MAGILKDLISPIAEVIGKVVPDTDKAREMAHEISTMAETQAHTIALAQIEVNKEEAKGNWFQSSWRPFVGWTCGVALAYHFVGQPVIIFAIALFGLEIPPLPEFDMGSLLTVLMGMLGLGGLRTFEKFKGVTS